MPSLPCPILNTTRKDLIENSNKTINIRSSFARNVEWKKLQITYIRGINAALITSGKHALFPYAHIIF